MRSGPRGDGCSVEEEASELMMEGRLIEGGRAEGVEEMVGRKEEERRRGFKYSQSRRGRGAEAGQ